MINREYLDEIINSSKDYENWWKPNLFKKEIKPLLPKELEIITPPPDEDKNCNCISFALGLSEDEKIRLDSNGFIYDTFFLKLLEMGILKYTNNPKDGDYVLYRDMEKYPNLITHVGIKKDTEVISKWSWGPLFKHAIFDVPASYGNDISYVEAITSEQAGKLYWEYKEFNILPKNY